jgi:threonine aldolase
VDDGRPIELRSDNSAGAAPEIFAALIDANQGSALAYGGDDLTVRLTEVVREVFEHHSAEVFPVSTGTAANSLALSALTPPWGAVLCHETAHIISNEGGATSMFSGGAVMAGLTGPDFTIAAESLTTALESVGWGDPHHSQPSVLSLTIPSDFGTITPPDQVARLAAIAKQRGLKVHIDGARIANAIAALGCAPADLTWRAGVDAFSLGAIKNGAVSTDAIVSFDPSVSEQLVYRTKRAGHVASKMRFQSAQLVAYLSDDLWLRLAGDANRTMARLAQGLTGLGVELVNRVDANMVFVKLPEAVIARLEESGLLFYRIAPGLIRFVTSFQTTDDDVDVALSRIAGSL